MDLLCRLGYSQEAIIVGIQGINQKARQRDLTPPFLKQDLDDTDSPLGKADDFLSFLEDEVIALVEKTYATNSKRTIIGHSREGLMVCYSLMAKPKLFDTRIALSPALWREDNLFVNRFETFLIAHPNIDSELYLSMGDSEVDKMKRAFKFGLEI